MRFLTMRVKPRSMYTSAAIAMLAAATLAQAQTQTPAQVPSALLAPDYSQATKIFPHIWEPYRSRYVPDANLTNLDPLEVHDGKLRLSMAQVVAAVVANNLTVASARYFPSMAQTDLLRSRSGASARGVDVAVIPSVVFAGAEGGSILGTAGGSGGGASNAGGITGSATSVNVRPSGVFDPSVSFSLSLDHTSSPLNSLVVSGIPSVTTGTLAYSFGYVQAFSTGTSFSLAYGYQRQTSTQLHLLYDPAYTPGFTATVSQQMLNGFGVKVNKALIFVAENEQKIERESFRQQTIAALSNAQNAYWDLIAAQESVRATELALEAAQRLAENNRKSFEFGVMSRLDVVTADSQVAASRRDLIVAQTNVQTAELLLKSLISKSLDEPLLSATIEATDTFPEPEDAPLPVLDQALNIGKQNRPEISIAQGNMKSQLDVQPFVRNSLLPNVNIFALLNTEALYNVFGTSFYEVAQAKYPQFAFGVSLTFPIHNRQAQADEIRSRLEYRQSEDTLVRTKSQVEVDVQNGVIAATQTKAQVGAAREATRLAVEKLDAEQKKLAAGISTPYNVILAQRDVFTARLAEVQARDAYAKARVTLDQAMGTTLETSHVTLDDALRGLLKTTVQ
jgi:outer membrane protein